MPLYDYVCNECKHHFEIFISYQEYGKKNIVCSHCGSPNIKRRITRPRVLRSDESRMESLTSGLTDPDALSQLEKDPKAMGKMMRKMGNELGEEMPAELDDVVDRLEKGQSPDEIEKDYPELSSGENDIGYPS
jgi:putative FmdB family regulatory protein